MTRQFEVHAETFPIRGGFHIARGSKTSAEVVVVSLLEDGFTGRGEAVPYGRYGESVDSVLAGLESRRTVIESAVSRTDAQNILPPGAARNALDCALWDLEAKSNHCPAWQLAGLPALQPLTTAFTLSLDSPTAMANAAAIQSNRPILKLKLGGQDDLDRVKAVRQAAPAAQLIVDANEGWTIAFLEEVATALAELGVILIEQPLPAAQDESLRGLNCPIPLAADESFHHSGDVGRLRGLYQTVNIKLDKAGGLTEALKAKKLAESAGFAIMVGCMVGSSLAMAPAFLLAQGAAFIDLDGPLLLETDRSPALRYDGSILFPPDTVLWG